MTQRKLTTQVLSPQRTERFSPFKAVLAWIRSWMRNRRPRIRTVQASELSDHMLRDIGLTRSDVRRDIDRPFWH